MGKKKKTTPLKIYNTRATSKEEAAVIKEQTASWWDRLISGDSDKKNEKQNEKEENKTDEIVRDSEECELSRSVSMIPTVSSVRSVSDNTEELLGSGLESSGSSFTATGDESVNLSPVAMKNPDSKCSKTASVYDILDYGKKNIPIPAKPDMSELLTPVKESLAGKSEYEIWMLRRDASLMAAKVKMDLENKSENVKEISPVNCRDSVMSESENVSVNVGFCADDVSEMQQMECSVAAAHDVQSTMINPSNCEPLDGGIDQRLRMKGNHVVGPDVIPDISVDGPHNSSPTNIPGLCNNKPINACPCENVSPNQNTALPSAAVADSEFGLQNEAGPVNNNSNGDDLKYDTGLVIEKEAGPTNVLNVENEPDNGPAVVAKAQKKVTFADIVQGPVLSPHVMKFGQFETVIQIKDDVLEIDPLRGTKYWNQELFEKLLRGDDVVDGETRLAYVGPKRNAEGIFEVNIEGHFMKKSYASNVFQLYGYFIGAVMPFYVVKENLIKMWHKYGLKSINMNRNGFFFFKFDHEEGMLQVLERNPWLVDNVPLVLQIWDPNVVLCKPNPKTVPVWVAIKDLPLSLWNGGNIGQIVSCVGKPLMLDQATFKRCETKEGPLNFARILVDANASNGLPDRVKINLPKCNGIPGKSYFLDLSYKWKPPCCAFCEVFGHTYDKCGSKIEKVQTKELEKNKKIVGNEEGSAQNEFVEVVKKSKVLNKGKQPVWQPKRTKIGPVNLEPGPSHQPGRNAGPIRQIGLNKQKPSDKAAGLQHSSDVGGDNSGLQKHGPTEEVTGLDNSLGSKMAAGLQSKVVSDLGSVDSSGASYNNPDMVPLKSDVHFPSLVDVGPVIKGPSKGSGFFDVSKNAFGTGPSPNVSIKNSFGTLRDEEECFDTDLGLWEHEIEMVKKFVDSSTRPKIEEYSAWSENLRKYYDSLTKVDGDEDEVESDTGETAQFMKIGSKF